MQKLPPHMLERFGTRRKFKDAHRQYLRAARWALRGAIKGCGYSPAHRDIIAAVAALRAALDATSRKNWGR